MTLLCRLNDLWQECKNLYRYNTWFRRLLFSIVGGFLLGFTALIVSLPNIEDLNKFTRAPSVLIKAEDGKIIGSFGNIYGNYVKFSDLPVSLVDAVLATEDRDFYHHFGIDFSGLARATIANIRAGRVVQGGSTITQQVAKNVFLTPERSLSRKAREILLAFAIEYRFSKEDILSIYLNRVYLGAGNYGVDSASKRYFGKSARQLTLAESAVLAGMLKAPSRFAPNTNPALAKKRASQVLLNMEDAGYLTQSQTEKAMRELDATLGKRQRDSQSSLYFSDWILEQLPEYVGNIQEDLVVTTTFDPDMQAMGEKAIADIMKEKAEALKAKQAALLAMSPDGAIRAMIGGRSYAGSQYNRVTQALRQPGSAFKLFVYLAGLEAGMTGDMEVIDEPISVPIVGGTWEPKNYTNKFLGTITLKEAVTESVNTVAVQVSQAAGLDRVTAVARRLGITTPILEVPSIALGATEVTLLELTSAYAHLANNGIIVYPYGITRIETASGDLVYVRQSTASSIALQPDVVGQMNELLLSVVENGTGKAATIGRPVAGKTGTTSDYRDAWFIGYAPQLVTGVWVGNDDNTPMKKVTGGMLPASIWHDFMKAALENNQAESIPTSSVPSAMPWQMDMTRDGAPVPSGEIPTTPEPAGDDETDTPIFRLPWQNDDPEEEEKEETPAPDGNLAPSAGAKRDVELGPSFWQKLMQ